MVSWVGARQGGQKALRAAVTPSAPKADTPESGDMSPFAVLGFRDAAEGAGAGGVARLRVVDEEDRHS